MDESVYQRFDVMLRLAVLDAAVPLINGKPLVPTPRHARSRKVRWFPRMIFRSAKP